MLTEKEIRELNEMMIGRGAPTERDDIGYNKPDFNRMYFIGMLNVPYSEEEQMCVVSTLSRYRNTQLEGVKDEIEETLEALTESLNAKYENKTVLEMNIERAIDGFGHDRADYEKEDINYWGVDGRSGLMMFTFNKYIQINISEFDGKWINREGRFYLCVEPDKMDKFTKYIGTLGKIGYKISDADRESIDEYIRERNEENSFLDDFDMEDEAETKTTPVTEPEKKKEAGDYGDFVLKDLLSRNEYGCCLYTITPSDGALKEKLWAKKGDCVSYVADKGDHLLISVRERDVTRFQNYCKVELGIDCSDIYKAIERKKLEEEQKNKSGNHLIDTDTLDLPFKPYDFQIQDAKEIVSKKKALIGHDMGCVSGKSKVRIKEQNKTATREVYVQNLFRLIQKDPAIQIKCLVNGRFAFMPIKAVIDKGVRETIRISTEHSSIECTPDHEFFTENGWIEAEKLKVGDNLFSNGTEETCVECGSDKNLITYPYAKWKGYCKSCMNRLKKNGYDGVVKKVDKNGYVRLVGNGTKDMPDYEKMKGQGGIYEHHQVWFENTGHVVQDGEVVHHKDLNKRNNKFDNLQLMTDLEHKLLHADINKSSLPQFNSNIDFVIKNGKKIFFVPQKTKITAICPSKTQQVYDIAIDDAEIHNFVCNGIVVHNCGKTFISTLVGLSLDMPKVVVCPESLRLNWKRELERTAKGQDIEIVYSKDKKISWGDWTIMGYHTATKFADKIAEKGIQCMFIDEAHNVKAVNNYGKPASKRAEALVNLARKMPYTYLLSGTPMPTRNKDLYNEFIMLGEINPDAPYAFHSFGKKYCNATNNGFGWDYNGSSNTEELHEKLNKYMTRRLKSDVLPDLKKQRQFIPLEEISKEYKDIEKRLADMEDEDTYMGLAMTGRRILSEVKVKPTKDLAETFVNSDESVVIVTEFNETMDKFIEAFGDEACYIRGGMSDTAKQKAIDDFQSGKKKVCILNTIAGGVGITLTKAHNMIVCDYDWTPANMTQVEDRICRTGQTECCNIYYMYCENALLDKLFVDMITNKSANIDKVVDNSENTVDLRGTKETSSSYLDLLKERIKEEKMKEKSGKKRSSKKQTKTEDKE